MEIYLQSVLYRVTFYISCCNKLRSFQTLSATAATSEVSCQKQTDLFLLCSPPVVLSLQSTGVCVLGAVFYQRACLRGTSSAWIARSPAGRDRIPFHDTNQSCPSFNLLGAGWTQDTAPMGWCMHLAPDWRVHLCPLSLPWQPSFFCPREMRHPGE